ncbi:MAG: Outer rane efflux protein [Chthoniobacter sp.]|nr:Outer rane efflux protein [Chthoniobacter sp.]
MIRRLTYFSAALLAFTNLPAPAAPGSGRNRTAAIRTITTPLTLDRAVAIALQQNPEILRQLQEIERTRGQVIEIRAQALPRVGLTGNFTQQDRRLLQGGGGTNGTSGGTNVIIVPPTTGTGGTGTGGTGTGGTTGGGETPDFSDLISSLGGDTGGSRSGPSDKSYRVALEASQVLYAGGQVRAAINIARFTQDSTIYQLRDVIDSIIARTRQQFYNVLLTRALIKVQEESIQLLSDQLKDQQNRFEAGTVPRFNVLRAEVELANARPELIRARNSYLIAQLELGKTLGLEAGPGARPSLNAVGELVVAERPLGLNNALALARERRPFLKVQRQTILIQKEQIKVALAGYKPRLEANGGYEIRNSSVTDELDQTIDGWFYGITGTWNIFDGFETYGRVKQARAQLESARINYDDSVQQVDLEVQQAYANLLTARETIRSQQKNVEQALEALRLASERLAAGAGTQLDVLDARVALTQARTTELQARADYNTNLAEFDRVTASDTIYDDTFDDPLTRGSRKPVPARKAPSKKKP